MKSGANNGEEVPLVVVLSIQSDSIEAVPNILRELCERSNWHSRYRIFPNRKFAVDAGRAERAMNQDAVSLRDLLVNIPVRKQRQSDRVAENADAREPG